MFFRNAANTPLNQNSGTVPDVSDAMANWFQPITFGVVTKAVVNFQVVETVVNTDFLGVWQPLSPRELTMKPEGERQWKWFWLHADPSLILQPDDIITYLGEQYRVMTQKDYRLYGYNEYHLINDYTGSGPTPVTPDDSDSGDDDSGSGGTP